MDEHSRRIFLKVVGAGAAGTAACSGEDAVGPQMVGDVGAGNVSNLDVGDLRAVPAPRSPSVATMTGCMP